MREQKFALVVARYLIAVAVGLVIGLALLAIVGGCSVGAVNSTQAESYDRIVLPIVDRCMSCHGPGASPDFTSFDTLRPDYYAKPGAASPLVTKGEHEGLPFLTQAEQAAIVGWIDGLP